MNRHPECTDEALHVMYTEGQDLPCPNCAGLYQRDAENAKREKLAESIGTAVAQKLLESGITSGVTPEAMARMERRMVRIETRNTNALRYLGLVPGDDVPPPGRGRVSVQGDEVVITSPEVTIREISEAAVLTGQVGELRLVYNNRDVGCIRITRRRDDNDEKGTAK